MAAKKSKLSISLDIQLTKRLDRLAKACNMNRSSLIEKLCRDGVEDAETTVQAFTDPVLLKAFGQAFGSRDVLKAMATAVHEEMSDSQLDLFTSRLRGLAGVAESADLSSSKSLERPRRGRGSGRREKAKPR